MGKSNLESNRTRGSFYGRNRELLSKETGNAITYVDESVEEAMSHEKMATTNWEYDAWVHLYSYQVGGTLGFQQMSKKS